MQPSCARNGTWLNRALRSNENGGITGEFERSKETPLVGFEPTFQSLQDQGPDPLAGAQVGTLPGGLEPPPKEPRSDFPGYVLGTSPTYEVGALIL